MTISIEKINDLSYPDFVGLMNQENTPPGGLDTIRSWIETSEIDSDSRIFDLACSTGFSSRKVAELCGCRSLGIDISEISISSGNTLAKINGLEHLLDYVVMDATKLNNLCGFTHVLGGCNFAFIQDREKALIEVEKVLIDKGFLCVSNFHYRKTPTKEILDNVERVLGWRPSEKWSLDYWFDFFSSKFELVSQEIKEIHPECEDSLRRRLEKTIFNESDIRFVSFSYEQRVAIFERLFFMRKVLNSQRGFQGYSVQVWRKK